MDEQYYLDLMALYFDENTSSAKKLEIYKKLMEITTNNVLRSQEILEKFEKDSTEGNCEG